MNNDNSPEETKMWQCRKCKNWNHTLSVPKKNICKKCLKKRIAITLGSVILLIIAIILFAEIILIIGTFLNLWKFSTPK